MARAIAAIRKGHEYQARVFWLHLLELRTGDFVESVCLESDGVSFVDDVVVEYREPIFACCCEKHGHDFANFDNRAAHGYCITNRMQVPVTH